MVFFCAENNRIILTPDWLGWSYKLMCGTELREPGPLCCLLTPCLELPASEERQQRPRDPRLSADWAPVPCLLLQYCPIKEKRGSSRQQAGSSALVCPSLKWDCWELTKGNRLGPAEN